MKDYQDVTRELMMVERAAWWNPRMRRILKAAPMVVLFLLLNTRRARAACSFNPAPDPTADGASNSLRAAIQMANASGQDCVIQLQAGTYTLTIRNTDGQENNAAEGDLDITDSGHTLTLEGQDPQRTIVNGKGINDRVFQVLRGANAVFRQLTIEGGIANDDGIAGALPGETESDGGGILVQNRGHVNLSHVRVERNRAVGGNGVRTSLATTLDGQAAGGGGLFLNTGTIDLIGSRISGNAAVGGNGTLAFNTHTGGSGGAGAGGGLYVRSGAVTLSSTTLSANSAVGGSGGSGGHVSEIGWPGGNGGQGAGGGLYVLSGTGEFVNSTISGNQAKGAPGGSVGRGISVVGSLGSKADGGAGEGAGLFIGAGALRLRRTTISGNTAVGGTGGAAFFGQGATPPIGGAGGSSQGAGMFVARGNLTLANGTLFANTVKGGAGGTASGTAGVCSTCRGPGETRRVAVFTLPAVVPL